METMHDIVSLHNIDDEDFIFEYNRAAGNLPYIIKVGDIRRFPRFLAQHALVHLIDKIMTKRKMKTNNLEMRNDLGAQIVVEVETFQQENRPTEAERLRKDVEELNKPSELDSILQKKKDAAANQPVDKDILPPLPEDQEDFAGLKPEPPIPEPEPVPTPVPTPEPLPAPEPVLVPEPVVVNHFDVDHPAPEMPTRAQLMDYAKNTLKMTLDDKTTKDFEHLKVAELIKALDYPMEGDNL